MFTQGRTHIVVATRYKITYKLRKALFGLVRWWEEEKANSENNCLFIETDQIPEDIYLIVKGKTYKLNK